jgi:hypothetical protein
MYRLAAPGRLRQIDFYSVGRFLLRKDEISFHSGRVKSSNENKISDGYRERALIEVEVF